MGIVQGMDLYVGLLVEKLTSGRYAQVASLDDTYVYLTWDDGKQTRVKRSRFNRESEWAEVGYYREQATQWNTDGRQAGAHHPLDGVGEGPQPNPNPPKTAG